MISWHFRIRTTIVKKQLNVQNYLSGKILNFISAYDIDFIVCWYFKFFKSFHTNQHILHQHLKFVFILLKTNFSGHLSYELAKLQRWNELPKYDVYIDRWISNCFYFQLQFSFDIWFQLWYLLTVSSPFFKENKLYFCINNSIYVWLFNF